MDSNRFTSLAVLGMVLAVSGLFLVNYGLDNQQSATGQTQVQGTSTQRQVCEPGEAGVCGSCNTCSKPGKCVSKCNNAGSAWECVTDLNICK